MAETTYELVKRVALEIEPGKRNERIFGPNATVSSLGLVDAFVGTAYFFYRLEEEVKKNNPDFEFPDEANPDTIQQVVEVIDQELARVGVES